VRFGQAVLFVVALALLGLHTFTGVRAGSFATIDGLTFGLLGVAAIAVVLPRIISFAISIGPKGLEARLQAAREAVEETTGAAPPTSTSSAAIVEATKGLSDAIEVSRQDLVGAMRELAIARHIAFTSGSLDGLAASLYAGKAFTRQDKVAVARVSALIQQALQEGASARLAHDMDLLTQTLAARFRKLAQEQPPEPS
jgi:hypothetical protein